MFILKSRQEKKWDLLILSCLLLFPHLLYSFMFQTPPGNDFCVYQPRALLRFFAYIQEGCLPLWSPLLYGGMSANFEHALSQSFSPITWLYALFPGTWNGNLIQVMLHFKLFLLGCGGIWAYLFFHRISGTRIAALFGAMTFMFNFRMLDNLRYATPLEILVLLPLLVLLIEGWLSEKSTWRYWLYPIVLGVMLLSGHPQHSLYNLLFISVYFLSRLFFLTPMALGNRSWAERFQIKRLFAFAGMNCLGIALAAPLLLPFQLDVIPQLYRRVLEEASRGDQHKMTFGSMVMSVLFPWFADVHSNFYSHISLCFFLFIALRIVFGRSETSKEQRFFLIFFLAFFGFALLYAFGSSAYVSTWVSFLVPPLKSTRAHGRILGTGIFCLSGVLVFVLQWIEYQYSLQKKIEFFPYRKFGIYFIGGASLGIIALFLIVIGVCWSQDFFEVRANATFSEEFLYFLGGYLTLFILQSDSPVFIHVIPELFLWQIFSFILFSSVALSAVYLLLSGNPSRKKMALVLLFLLIVLETRFYHAWGTWFEPTFPKQLSTTQFLSWDTFHQRFFPEMEYQSPIVQETSQFYLNAQVADFNAPKNIALFLLSGGKPASTLFENLTQGKLFLPQLYSVVPDLKTALAQNKNDLRTRCIIEASESVKIPWKNGFPILKEIAPGEYFLSEVQAGFQLLSYTPNGIIFRMKMSAPGIVNYLDASHPGFVATVDRVPVEWIRTYGAFKGVWVPSGIHEVSIQYRPNSFFYALKLVWIAGIWIGMGSLIAFLKHKKYSWKPSILWLLLLFLLLSLFCWNAEQKLVQMIENPIYTQYREK